MNESYDPGTHLLVIALIVFYWHLLRIWHQPPPDSRHGKTAEKKEAAAGPAPKLAPVASRNAPTASDRAAQADPAPTTPPESPLAIIHAVDGGFDEKAFLAGAARAYELVVNAYAEEDMEVLDSLLDPQTSADFKDAITARRLRDERLAFTFIGLNEVEIVKAWREADLAEITVHFTSEAVAAAYGPDGKLLDGHPARVVEMTDTWTFARCLTARDPNWKLVAT